MPSPINANIILSAEIEKALENNKPVVALESTVITHGLPYPANMNLAMDMENEVRAQGALPATIAVLDGQIRVGVTSEELRALAETEDARKISLRDFSPAMIDRASGGTTVAGTMYIAHKVGIKVFATGGIGGVHRSLTGEQVFDISTDLPALTRYPVLVVSAGAKAILDLPATVEYLETAGVPVLGYGTRVFPAFYSTSSGLEVSASVRDARQAAQVALQHWGLGFHTGVLVVVPPPAQVALQPDVIEAAIRQALEEAGANGIHGQHVSPFLLEKVTQHTAGESLRANLGLLLNNASIAAHISREMLS